MRSALLACLLACLAFVAGANEAARTAADPALEERMLAVAAELRCLVCQNQTIADSHAELAVDLRNQVRDMLRNGQSEKQIIDYMTARYGDFVLYRPPVKATTLLLWFGPVLLMVGGLAVLWLALRRRNRMGAEHFDADDEDALDATQSHLSDTTAQPARATSHPLKRP